MQSKSSILSLNFPSKKKNELIPCHPLTVTNCVSSWSHGCEHIWCVSIHGSCYPYCCSDWPVFGQWEPFQVGPQSFNVSQGLWLFPWFPVWLNVVWKEAEFMCPWSSLPRTVLSLLLVPQLTAEGPKGKKKVGLGPTSCRVQWLWYRRGRWDSWGSLTGSPEPGALLAAPWTTEGSEPSPGFS